MKAIKIGLVDSEIQLLKKILPGFDNDVAKSIYNKIQHQVKKNWHLNVGDLVIYEDIKSMTGKPCWGFITSFDYEDDDAARFSLGKTFDGTIYKDFAPGLRKGKFHKATLKEVNEVIDEIYHYSMKSSPYSPWGKIDELVPKWASKMIYNKYYRGYENNKSHLKVLYE